MTGKQFIISETQKNKLRRHLDNGEYWGVVDILNEIRPILTNVTDQIDVAYNRGISVAANQTIDDAITLIEMDNEHRSYISEIGMKCFEEGEIITYLESLWEKP